MNSKEIYNIALDMLLKKKSNGFGFNSDNSTITVLSTSDEDIFKASNGNTIKDGKLQSTCSEYEAITMMMKSNKSKIEYIVTLNIETGAFVIPCNSCLELMAQINSNNPLYCNVLTDVEKCVQLHTLLPSENADETNWLDGWDTDTTSQEQEVVSNPFDDDVNISPQKENPFGSLPFFEDNPIPNKPDISTKKNNSSYYQSKYLNMEPNSVSVGTTFKQNDDITNKMRRNGLSESDKKNFNKQRLYNAFTVENVVNLNGNQNNMISEFAEKQTLSKKELLKLAKEKKKMAKKDAKILEASNKRK